MQVLRTTLLFFLNHSMDKDFDSNSDDANKEEERTVVGEGLDVHFDSEPLTPSTLPHCLNDVTTEGK